MKGLSPAQASQAAAGTSAMRLTTFTARLSLPSGIRRPPGLQMLPHQMTPIGQQTRGSIRLQKPGVLQRGDLRLEALQLRSEEHTSELQSLMRISYAVFCLKKKN